MAGYRASFDASITFGNVAAGIPVVEHLAGLGQLPPTGARFTAVPLRVEGFGTIPVRAFARLPR